MTRPLAPKQPAQALISSGSPDKKAPPLASGDILFVPFVGCCRKFCWTRRFAATDNVRFAHGNETPTFPCRRDGPWIPIAASRFQRRRAGVAHAANLAHLAKLCFEVGAHGSLRLQAGNGRIADHSCLHRDIAAKTAPYPMLSLIAIFAGNQPPCSMHLQNSSRRRSRESCGRGVELSACLRARLRK